MNKNGFIRMTERKLEEIEIRKYSQDFREPMTKQIKKYIELLRKETNENEIKNLMTTIIDTFMSYGFL